MQGGTRDFVVLRTAVAIACAALIAMIAAPAAFAGSPAGDQYGSALPGGGSGGSTSGSSTSGGSETTIPVAPDSSSGTQATGGSSGTKVDSTGNGGNGGNGGSSQGVHKGDSKQGDSKSAGTGSGNSLGTVDTSNTNHSVPQIAADSAGDSWLPFFIGGMVALACAAAALVFFRNRRRTAQG